MFACMPKYSFNKLNNFQNRIKCLLRTELNVLIEIACIYDTVFHIIVLIEMGSTVLQMKTTISYSYR
jgi:hypothetical protein